MPTFNCQKCEFQQSVSVDYVGKTVKCPQCSTVSLIEEEIDVVDDLKIVPSHGSRRRSSRARRWHSNPWILAGLIFLFTAVNIGMTVGGIWLVIEHRINTIRAEYDDLKL